MVRETLSEWTNSEISLLLNETSDADLIFTKQFDGVSAGSLESLFESLAVDPMTRLIKGLSCFYAFLQCSWTGPKLTWNPMQILGLEMTEGDLNKFSLNALEVDGEPVYHLLPNPVLLYIAKVILVDESEKLGTLKSSKWWKHRVVFIHQQCINSPCSTLKSILDDMYDQVSAELATMGNKELQSRIELEHGMVHHYYTQNKQAMELFEKAQEYSSFKWSLSGALGKRTKFQTFDVSQLVITAQSSTSSETQSPSIPTTLELNDDTLLETIKFTEDIQQSKLQEMDQCILLANCLNVRNTNAMDTLTAEEMFPYVRRVLENPNNWIIHTMALLLRSRLESNKSRTVERGCLQLQALVDQFGLDEVGSTSVPDRIKWLFCTLLPSKWELEKELGHRFVSLGVIRSALEIFTRLELWEDAISCHQMLDQQKKAEKIVLDLLSTSETPLPNLLCILGDLRKDISLYYQAWESSGNRYARAMRSLGAHYYQEGNWEKCVESYENAVSINSLFENSWFILGCAAMHLGTPDAILTAENAFQRVCSLNPENSEAWNNLASIYIAQRPTRNSQGPHQGKRLKEAYRALREALKQSHDASNIWENFLYVCVDLGEFNDAVRAIDRIFDIRIDNIKLKDNAIDVEILGILVTAIEQNVEIAQADISASSLTQNLLKLFAKLTSRISLPQLYTLSARMFEASSQFKLSLENYLKSYRQVYNDPSLLSNMKTFEMLVEKTVALVDAYKRLGPILERPRMGEENDVSIVCKDWLYQSKMSTKAVIGRTKSTYEGMESFETLVRIMDTLKSA